MNAFRRLYQYTVILISLLTLNWSTILLLRALLNAQVSLSPTALAGGIAFILVSAPVFTGHWLWAQREVREDAEARASTLRLLFFFVALTALLLPVMHNALAWLGRTLHQTLAPSAAGGYPGQGDTLTDNLTAIVINLAWVAYLAPRTRQLSGEHLPVVRRLYRYFWSLYGLGFLVGGVVMLLRDLIAGPGALGGTATVTNGIALALTGAVVWGSTWRVVQQQAATPEERNARLRAVVLYILTLSGLIGLMASLGTLLNHLLRALLGDPYTAADWLDALRNPVAWGIPTTALWLYFRRVLLADLAHIPESTRRHGLQRLYRYAIAFIGLVPSFLGVFGLLTFLVDAVGGRSLRPSPDELAVALSLTLVGLPLWWFAWQSLTREAAASGEAGEHARRSRVRKGYLYLAVFIGTVGAMFGAGALVFHMLEAMLGATRAHLGLQLLHDVKNLLMFGLLLGYHGVALRRDARAHAESLRARYAAFPVLILTQDDAEAWIEVLSDEIERQAPGLPIAVHAFSAGAPDEALSAARAVILPADWADHAPEAFFLWLKGFAGYKVLLPPANGTWVAAATGRESTSQQAHLAARLIRQLAEGESPQTASGWPLWAWALVVPAGLITLLILMSILAPLFTQLFD